MNENRIPACHVAVFSLQPGATIESFNMDVFQQTVADPIGLLLKARSIECKITFVITTNPELRKPESLLTVSSLQCAYGEVPGLRKGDWMTLTEFHVWKYVATLERQLSDIPRVAIHHSYATTIEGALHVARVRQNEKFVVIRPKEDIPTVDALYARILAMNDTGVRMSAYR